MLLTEEQTLIRDTMRAFAQEQLAPHAARWDREHHFPRAELAALGELGALGMVVPERWGGAGMDYVSLAVALEEIAAGDGATSTIVSVQNSVVCGPIHAYGTDAQKERWLVPLARGEAAEAVRRQALRAPLPLPLRSTPGPGTQAVPGAPRNAPRKYRTPV